MSNVINLLPESVANQIAAGEVVQRPASVVKELLENSIDAGSTKITLIVKDSGKSLLQIIDNGCGMSAGDARLSFERHATSKIKKAEDIFSITSYGFRGEALASIASVARVQLKTRQKDSEIGTSIEIEGSKFISQEDCSTPIGTNFIIKDLFFNIPARRQFLKTDNAEMRHIWDEFYRVAIANPNIDFEFYSESNILIRVMPSNLRQRISGLFGKIYNQRLLPVSEETSVVKIDGFIIKPEFSKKTRGEQFLFVNNRFIKSVMINNAVKNAFKGLIAAEAFPGYFLFIDVDAAEIDVNIHPTKTEIKFRDERMLAAIVTSVVRKSLGVFNAVPSIDFDIETQLDFSFDRNKDVKMPQVKLNPDYNPFKNTLQPIDKISNTQYRERWEEFYEKPIHENTAQLNFEQEIEIDKPQIGVHYVQVGKRYITANVETGMLLIDQCLAHRRIVFDRLLQNKTNNQSVAQQLLSPEKIELSRSDATLMSDIVEELNKSGFVISQLGEDCFSVSAIPECLSKSKNNIAETIELILEEFKNSGSIKKDFQNKLLLSMSEKTAISQNEILNQSMMQQIVKDLFKSSNSEFSPDGKRIWKIISLDELQSIMNNK